MNARVTNLTGRQGGIVIADTTATTPASGASWHALLVVEEAVLAAVTDTNLENASDLVGKTLPAGLILYGNFTALQLTSGTVIAYLT
jgi:hypothetical protein